MLSTENDSIYEAMNNSELEVVQSFEENLTKNFEILTSPAKNIDGESGNKFDELICSLIKKQTEQDNKAKNETFSRIKEVLSNISDKIKREQSHIYDYKFHDYLLSVGFDNESSSQLTNYFLDTYDGSLDLNELKAFFEQFESCYWKFNSELLFKKMITCSLMPGILDAFTDEKFFPYDQLTDKLFQFILSHRLPAQLINSPYLENCILVGNLRRKILLENENKFYEENRKNKSIYVDEQCISSIKSCCCQEKIHNIIDGKWMTYWQTANSEKWEDHYILIMLKESLKLSSLSLFSIGNKSDEFLKSITIEVRAGGPEKLETVVSKCDYNLTLNNEYSICNCFPDNQSITYLKIVFKRSNEKSYWAKANDQLKIRSIKLVGQKVVSHAPSLSVQDATICWYFEMLSAMALVQSQIMPSLHTKILQITKNTLDNMPPLSLTLESKKTFLTPNVLEKVDSFLKNLLEVTSTSTQDKSESILIYVSFNLARGNLKGIMKSLILILENFSLEYEFRSLIVKINEASQLSLRKTAHKVGFKSLKIANEPKSEKLNETEIISTVEDESTEFSLESFRPSNSSIFEINSCFNIVLEVENNVTLTNINLKLKVESIGINSVVVILLFDKTRPKIENFTQYDSFTSKEQFNFYIKNSQSNKQSSLYEAFYFELYENQIDIMLEIPVTKMANFAIVKLLRPKNNSPKTVVISNVNLTGFKHSSLDIFTNLSSLSSSLDKRHSPASILVSAILWFCCQLAEQHKKLSSNWFHEEVNLIDFENFEIDDLWKIYLKSIQILESNSDLNDFLLSNLKVPILILLFELVNCIEIKSNLTQTKSSHILQNLCNIIDAYEGDKKNDNLDQKNQMLLEITKEIIRNGVGVFFQQNDLLELFESLIRQKTTFESSTSDSMLFNQDMSLNKTSNQILFQACCKQLTEKKIDLIQFITKSQNPYENFTDLNRIIVFIEKLVNLTFTNELNVDSETEFKLIRASNQLINSLQSNVFYNIQNKIRNKQIDNDCVFENMIIKNINHFLNDYTRFLFKKCNELQNLYQCNDKCRPKHQYRLDFFLRNILYNFVLWLANILDSLELNLCTMIATECANLLNLLNQSVFIKSKTEKRCEKEVLLKSWTFNSKTKSSIFDLAIEYSYPLAKRFVIDLDSECKLNNSENSDSASYSFIDSNEQVYNITKKVDNKETIDFQIVIDSDSSIIFNIHSSKDLKLSNQFFLKFTINAYGYDQEVNKPRIIDLVHLLSSLIGTNLHKVLSGVYKTNYDIAQIEQSCKSANLEKQFSKDESLDKTFLLCGFQHQFSVNSLAQAQVGLSEKNQAMVNMSHDYYRILFRSGYQNLTMENNSSNQKLHSFLSLICNDLPSWLNFSNYKDSKRILAFLALYDKTFSNAEKSFGLLKNRMGGLSVSEIIIKIFCVIVWHDSSINYEDLFNNEDFPVYNENVMKAYKTAESTRMYILEKQLIFKNKQHHLNRSLAEILDEKIMFLLNFHRPSSDTINYELSRNSKSVCSDHSENIVFSKKKGRLPKTESRITNLVFQFIFDQDILKIDSIEQILNYKKQNSDLANQNFEMTSNFLQNIIQNDIDIQLKNECVLLFLSSFFSTSSNSKYTKYGSFIDQTRSYFHTNQKPVMIHYLQNLYGCGIENEALVQKSFYKLITILVNFSTSMEKEYYFLSKADKDSFIRLKCFVSCFLNIEWELKDLEFVKNLHLYDILVKNMIISMPICEYQDERQSTPSEILEDFFDFSKEKFEQVVNKTKNKEYNSIGKEKSTCSVLSSVQEVEEIEDSFQLEKSIKEEKESFDIKIFPDMYQTLFQINSSKQFDTTSLLKSVSTAITTHEQYQKYLVARYMFWKYFSKLNTNFYCDNCEAVLTGFRYVCLECRDYCYCFTCFSKSIIEKKCNSAENCHKPVVDISKSSSHQPTHPMLVLDHYCNQCQSLIIGKRIKCLECFDFDLCLACSKKPEFSFDGHHQDHKTKVIEPTILTSKSAEASDAQTFLFLHSQILCTNLALKICDFFKYNSNENGYTPLIRDMYSNIVNTLIFLSSRTDMETNNEKNKFVTDLKFYMFYNQKNIIGQLAYVIKSTKHMIKEIGSEDSLDLNLDAVKYFFDSLPNRLAFKNDVPSLLKILNYVLILQDKMYHNVFADNISIMFIGMMKSWMSILKPESVNKLAKNHLEKNENSFVFQELAVSKREYLLELIFCWIYEYMITGFDKLACSYLDLMFGMNQMSQWKPHVQNFLANVLDSISESLDNYNSKIHSRLYFLTYAVICFQMDISSGQWVDYKSSSQYDGAGILRSIEDFKIGLANNFYSESFGSDSFLSIKDPESRRTVNLKYKKLDNTWRKSNDKSKIPIKSNFDLNQASFLKLIEIFGKIFASHSDIDATFESAEDLKSMALCEKNHINKKREFYKFYKKKICFNKNLLALGLINLMQSYVNKTLVEENFEDLISIDPEFLRLVSKISFLNTNLNSNWKLNHLNIFLTSLLLFDNFAHIINSLEKGESKEETPTSESKPVSRTINTISSEKSRLNRTTDLDEAKKISSKDELCAEDLIGQEISAVISVCDMSSRIFPMEDMTSNFVESNDLIQKRNKASLRLIEDCFNKLSKYETNKSEDCKANQLFPKQQAAEPIRTAIKIVSHACIVLSSRELLVLLMNLSAKLAKPDLNMVSKKESFLDLSLDSEYDLIQLLDVLYYSERPLNFKYLVQNFIRSFIDRDKSNKWFKVLKRICSMACEFMLPEFKLLRKVSWSCDDVRYYDEGKIKNKTNNEALSEENINFNSSQSVKTLSEVEKLSSITSKPSDVEKLSCQDQSTLLIVFDKGINNKAKLENFVPDKNNFEKYFDTNTANNTHSKYCLGDDFEFKDEVFSDSESLNSIEETMKSDKKSNKKNKSIAEMSDEFDSSVDDNEEDIYDGHSSICSEAVSKKNVPKAKKTCILFQIVPMRKNSSYNLNEDYDEEDQDEDENEIDEEDRESETGSENSDSDGSSSNYEFNSQISSNDDFYADERWDISVNNTGYTDNQENRVKKKKFKINLENLRTIPYIAIKNEKMLKWKFLRNNADFVNESCSFKIFTILSKNFEPAFNILDEIINQVDCAQLNLNELWCSLIKICNVQSFNRRLKVLSLLIKICQKVYQASDYTRSIDIFEVKSLRNLHLTVQTYNTEDKNFSRSLYELFFFVEKLAIKWSIQNEYLAKMQNKEYFLHKVIEMGYFIDLFTGSMSQTSGEKAGKNSNINTFDDMFTESEGQETSDDDIYSSPQGCSRKNSDEQCGESLKEINLFEQNW